MYDTCISTSSIYYEVVRLILGHSESCGRCYKPSARTASPSFALYSFSASVQTLALSLWGNCVRDGKRSELNCSEASRGSRVGKWSMEMTDSGELPALRNHSDDLCILRREIINIPYFHGHSWIRESRINGVDGDRVVWIGGITADVHHN